MTTASICGIATAMVTFMDMAEDTVTDTFTDTVHDMVTDTFTGMVTNTVKDTVMDTVMDTVKVSPSSLHTMNASTQRGEWMDPQPLTEEELLVAALR